jgi:hypothetical protein
VAKVVPERGHSIPLGSIRRVAELKVTFSVHRKWRSNGHY